MDSFFGIGISELFFIAVIALIVLGPERLPGALREVAKFMRTIRSLTNELTSQFGDEFKALEDLNPQKLLRELTEDPEEKAKAAKAATTTKPAAKPTPKPATSSTTKPATPKPATTKPATSTTSTATKPTTPKPATTTKSTGTATTSTTVKPVTEDAVATAEEVAVAVEEAPVAEKSATEAVTVDEPVLDGTEAASPELAVSTADAPIVDASLSEEATAPVAADEEYSILPPARPEETTEETTVETTMESVGVYPSSEDVAEDVPTDEQLVTMAAEDNPVMSVAETAVADEPVVDGPTDISSETPIDSAPQADPETLLKRFQAKQLLNQPTNQSANLNGARVNGTNTENEP